MATDKNVLRFKLSKEKLGRNRRTKKGRKRDRSKHFQITNGAEGCYADVHYL